MTLKIKKLALPLLIFSIILVGCTQTVDHTDLEKQLADKVKEVEQLVIEKNDLAKVKEDLKNQIEELKNNVEEPLPEFQQLGPSQNVLSTSLEIIELIKDNDMVNLSEYVHPTQGLRLTPYFYIETQNNQFFTSQEVAGLGQNTTVFNWGVYDGSGEPIDLTFSSYYTEFIYDEDFINPHLIGNNVPIGSGNMIDNIDQAYPNGHFVEFHFTGFDSQYAGMDWRSLRLVLEQDNGLWYLVGIVHGQWTI